MKGDILINNDSESTVTIINGHAKSGKELQENQVTSTTKQEDHNLGDPPDGGTRAWLVMIGAFLCNGIIFGIINTYSVIYLQLQHELKEKGDPEASSKAALVGSLTIGTTFFLSPVSGILTDKIGLRRTTFLGGVLTSGGMMLSSFFTHNISVLYLTYGVMFGLGAALAYTPSLAILGHYFKRYLGLVNGIVTAGSSVFTALMPLLLKHLVQTTNLATTFRVMSLTSSFIVFCAFLYKPLHGPPPPPKKKHGRSQCYTIMRSFINFDNWKKKKYIIWSLSIPVALFGYFVPYVHMGKFVLDKFPSEPENAPVMCIGIASGIGRLLFGFIGDFKGINRILLQQMAFVLIGTLTMLLPVTESFSVLLIFALILGLFDGCFITLLGPIAYDICGPRGATQAIGFLLGLCSIPLTIGPPIAGLLYDHTGSYLLPFVLAGIPPLIGATAMFCIRCIKTEGSGCDVEAIEQNSSIAPIASNAWNCESSLDDSTKQDEKLLEERKASLASTESLTDSND